MEGSANLLRQRDKHRKLGPGSEIRPTESLDEGPSSPKGEKSDTMAAGSSRIIRYVLFAFFVGRYLCNSVHLRIDNLSRVS